jgi:hypothetical protein
MPAKDIYHDCVKNALTKDGWTITHDPLRLSAGTKDMYVDFGLERVLAAKKAEQKIAIEVKSFVGDSQIDDLEKAIGQYVIYRAVIAEKEQDRILYLAVPQNIIQDIFEQPLGQILLKHKLAQLISFDPQKEVIRQWIP